MVDHFIPWSRYPLDLGHNYVLADARCNGDKADRLAAYDHLSRWCARNARRDLMEAFEQRMLPYDDKVTRRVGCWAYEQADRARATVWERGREGMVRPRLALAIRAPGLSRRDRTWAVRRRRYDPGCSMEHRIELANEARSHLESLSARERAAVLDIAREQLTHEPSRPTRNRKPMRPNPLAPWVLRIGHLRVYYEVTEGPVPCVTIRAIGVKARERVLVGGLEIDLS